jgi:hypothetical protein
MNCTRIPIDEAVIFSFPILTHSAKTSFSLGDTALCGTEFTLDFSPSKGSEIRRKLCFNETFLNDLSPGGFWRAEEVPEGKHAEARPTKLQKLPFGQLTIHGFSLKGRLFKVHLKTLNHWCQARTARTNIYLHRDFKKLYYD